MKKLDRLFLQRRGAQMVPLFAYWQQNIAGHSPVRAGDAGFGPSISVPGFYVFTMKKIGIRSAS
ncbi:hypothetical protein [Parageobacillus thermoglucosidasius]|uniref:Uncharacterized protein n=1 Tax=Parageobacillus thermoglucosidasius TaxID=1426 RepID=A0AB38R3V1_PARTM|nr:hypothetical protein [Parageobacillus thermoglucosidasius]UOE78299.1 hypothetical protein IMI45_19970 [Parageobacillus thermoglucosidasius]